MRTRTRLLVTVVVAVLSLWAIYPPAEKIKLGLDLKGGVHFILRVRTDEAVRLQTEAAAERLRRALVQRDVRLERIEARSATELVVHGVDDETALLDAIAEEGDDRFDRVAEGRVQTLQLKAAVVARIRQDTLQQALSTIERRVNELGVAEPEIAPYGTEDQILVQLPGFDDVARAKRIISADAQLQLTIVDRGPFPTSDAARQAYGGSLPPDVIVLPYAGDAVERAYYVVRRVPAVAGADLRDAQPSRDEFNRPAVAFTLAPEAAARFSEATARNVNRLLATVLDDRIVSVATILERISDRGQIVGLTREEAVDLAISLRAGALPASVDYLHQTTVSATLGQASIRAGVLASVGGLALVALFMLAYYRAAGLNAVVSIVLNLLIQLALLAYFGAAMTLPGIAGLLLTIGMGVDSNVLIFERIKEESARASGPHAAVIAGFDRVWTTIVDTHVASLIAAAVLFQFGTSAIRGFATTLTLGLVANVFTAVFVSRTLFDLALSGKRVSERRLSI